MSDVRPEPPLPEPSLDRAKTGSFRELFPAAELRLYAAGTAVYIALALATHDVVLNWLVLAIGMAIVTAVRFRAARRPPA